MRNPEVFCTELGIVDQHKEDAILALSKMSQANDHVKVCNSRATRPSCTSVELEPECR